MNTSRGRSGSIVGPQMARAAAVAADISRTQSGRLTGNVSRKSSDTKSVGKTSADEYAKKDESGSPFDDAIHGGKTKKGQSAGSAGDFKPLKGSKAPFDNNADKGENSAPNDTGKPNTPSGI